MLVLDRGGAIENWPHQHYDSGVAKNTRTSKRFKAIVRIIKRLRNLMQEAGTFVGPAPSYLLECLVWNAPDSCFAHATLGQDVRSVMAFLVVNTASDLQCAGWVEVNERKYLFHFSQTWSREQAHSFLSAGWARLGLG
jgi:hypothetical protein